MKYVMVGGPMHRKTTNLKEERPPALAYFTQPGIFGSAAQYFLQNASESGISPLDVSMLVEHDPEVSTTLVYVFGGMLE